MLLPVDMDLTTNYYIFYYTENLQWTQTIYKLRNILKKNIIFKGFNSRVPAENAVDISLGE